MNRSRAIVVGMVLIAVFALVALLGSRPEVRGWMHEGGNGESAHAPSTPAAADRSVVPASAAATGAQFSRGLVVDADAAPIAGARILAREGSPRETSDPFAEAVSDASGSFEIPCRPTGWAEVLATGFERGRFRLHCRDGEVFRLETGVVVEGTVVRAGTKEPVNGANVLCARSGELMAVAESESREDGSFSLTTCGAGPLAVRATHAGFASVWKELGTPLRGSVVKDVVLELSEGRRLTGRVVDASGVAVPLAEIVIADREEWGRLQALRSDETGGFVATIGRDAQTVGAVAPDGRATSVRVAAGEADPVPVELRLPKWGRMTGRVVGDVTGLKVRASRESDAAETPSAVRDQLWARTGRGTFYWTAAIEGDRFTFENVEPGRYDLIAHSDAGQGEAAAKHDDRDIVIRIEGSARPSFRVSWEDGAPAEGLLALVSDEGEITVMLKDGKSPNIGIPSAEYTAFFYPQGTEPVPAPTTYVAESGEREVTWVMSRDSVAIEGVVRAAGSGTPIEGARVSLAVPYSESVAADQQRYVTTAADGHFRMTVSSLDVELFVMRDGYVSAVVLAKDAAAISLTPGVSEEEVKRRPATGKRPTVELRPGKS